MLVGSGGSKTRSRSLTVMPGAIIRKASAKRVELRARRVQGLPGDEHRHHRRFAGAGGELESDPEQLWVGLRVQHAQPLLLGLRGHLRQPYGGLRRFDLAEEEPVAPLRVAPMPQQPGRDCGNGTQAGIAQCPPSGHLGPNLVDVVVGLALSVLIFKLKISLRRYLVLRRRHRHDELAPTPSIGINAIRDTVLVELPMTGRRNEGAVQYRVVDNGH